MKLGRKESVEVNPLKIDGFSCADWRDGRNAVKIIVAGCKIILECSTREEQAEIMKELRLADKGW